MAHIQAEGIHYHEGRSKKNLKIACGGPADDKTTADIERTVGKLEKKYKMTFLNNNWRDEQIKKIEDLAELEASVEKDYGLVSTRSVWTQYCRPLDDPTGQGQEQLILGSLLSGKTQDKSLINVMMALRKLDLFSIRSLSRVCENEREVDKEVKPFLRFLENLFLWCGYNFWTDKPAQIIGFATAVVKYHKSKIPEDARILHSFQGVGRKVLMLMLQDAFEFSKHGIVSDSHVAKGTANLGMLTKKYKDPDKHANKIAEELEEWLPSKYYRQINEVLGGLRQLWRESGEYREKIKEVAKKQGKTDLLGQLVQDLEKERKKPNKVSDGKSK